MLYICICLCVVFSLCECVACTQHCWANAISIKNKLFWPCSVPANFSSKRVEFVQNLQSVCYTPAKDRRYIC